MIEQLLILGASVFASLLAVEYRLRRKNTIEVERRNREWLVDVRQTIAEIDHSASKWAYVNNIEVSTLADDIEEGAAQLYRLASDCPGEFSEDLQGDIFALSGELDKGSKRLLLFATDTEEPAFDRILDGLPSISATDIDTVAQGISGDTETSSGASKEDAKENLREISLEKQVELLGKEYEPIQERVDRLIQQREY